MKNSRLAWGTLAILLLGAIVLVFHSRIHFDPRSFVSEVRHMDWRRMGLGVLLIYLCYWLRALRWAVFLKPQKKVSAFTVLGSQFIGFTAVGLFGRLADLTRPYLTAKKTKLSVSSQIAVYTIERMFDLGAAALIFSGGLALAAEGQPIPHAEVFARVGGVSLMATVGLAVFAVALRMGGGVIARMARRVFGIVSREFGEAVAEKIDGFREGLNAFSSLGDLATVAALSLAMWGLIAVAYQQAIHSFVDTPVLAQMSFAQTMLLMASSVAGSVVQLPVIGWFTQIAAIAAVMQAFFGVPVEAATACSAVILLVTSLSVVPAGLIYAQVERVSIRGVGVEAKAEAVSEEEARG